MKIIKTITAIAFIGLVLFNFSFNSNEVGIDLELVDINKVALADGETGDGGTGEGQFCKCEDENWYDWWEDCVARSNESEGYYCATWPNCDSGDSNC